MTRASHHEPMTPIAISTYARTLRACLPKEMFAPVPARLGWFGLYVLLIGAGITAVAMHPASWVMRLLLALVIGHGFAGIAFVGHELMHGAIVRAKRLRHVLGWLCFLPFTMSPRLWIAWHNRVHHGHTMQAGVDPDAYPTLSAYKRSRMLRLADRLSPARGRWLGWIGLAIGFTLQSKQVLLRLGRTPGYLPPRQYVAAVVETLLGVLCWAGLALLIGPGAFVFAFVLPLLIANAVVMSYILTNHNLSPLTDINDPLLNSLSVTTPRFFARLHLNFGLHVEHHLFPAMSAVHAESVRAALLRLWPERYQSMTLPQALWRLFSTPRVYKDPRTLIDPPTGREHPTLLPADLRRCGSL